MTKNTKNYTTVKFALAKLAGQLATEAKSDPRFKRGHGRVVFIQQKLETALEKYEVIHARKVPAKVKARAAKVKVAKKGKPNLKVVASAAKRHVKRSK